MDILSIQSIPAFITLQVFDFSISLGFNFALKFDLSLFKCSSVAIFSVVKNKGRESTLAFTEVEPRPCFSVSLKFV